VKIKHFIYRILLFSCVWSFGSVQAERTDIATETYVEYSEVDFILQSERINVPPEFLITFNVFADKEMLGVLLTFIDGEMVEKRRTGLPFYPVVSTRKLTLGPHRITLQFVSDDGNVGYCTFDITK